MKLTYCNRQDKFMSTTLAYRRIEKPEPRLVELVMVDRSLIQQTNSKLDHKTIEAIIKEGINNEKFGVLPAFFDGKKWILTDGNHRVEVAKLLDIRFIPIAPLTKEEFDYVKFSPRKVDLMVKIPEKPKYYTA